MKNNITLIGMPGAGKSTVGVVLAKVMGYRFVDSDLVIQEKTGKLLSEIIAHLKKISTVVYLKLPYEKVEKRLGNLKDRGVALKEGQTLRDLYEERCPLYEKYADVVIDADTTSVEGCMRRILDEVK